MMAATLSEASLPGHTYTNVAIQGIVSVTQQIKF